MNTPCSVARLESALAGSLPADDEASLHRHLEECEECGAALERMAGGVAWCQEAAALLARDELDAAVPIRDEWSAVDFTVEHLEPSDEPNVLGRLGGYDVLEIIGHGGMGVVLKAFDRELKRCVAIKVLAPHLAQSSLAKKRFAREAQAAAAVVHPHVLAIHQVQPSGRLPFLVMPLVAGESLAERLTAQGTLELKEILRIGMQAAAGLAAAHEQGLVHRDVKPANILLEKGVERAVLTDFGLARAADDVTLTRWGIIAGTPQYMSPEQARGDPLDGRSDLFSLGCVIYEMATGVSPFRADSMMATMRRLVDDSPQAMASLNPELPPWFIAIVDRLLEKDASRRFGSATEVSELLEGCLAHVQQPANVPLPAGLPKPAIRPNRLFSKIGINGVLAMIAALGIGLFGFFLLSAEPPDIAGQWSGEEWGHVILKKTNDGEYTGTYSDTFGKQPGSIQLNWSRIERRFNGTWREGEDRFGELSVRLSGEEIRGAHTTDPKSKINPATPHLADLLWTRAKETVPIESAAAPKAAFGPVMERLIPFGAPCEAKYFQFHTGDVFEVGTGPGDTSDHAEQWRRIEASGGVDVLSLGWKDGIQFAGKGCIFTKVSSSEWETITAEEVVAKLRQETWITGVIEAKRADFPLTYLFKTARGESGILQIQHIMDDDRGYAKLGIKIRYKLVRAPQDDRTSSAEPHRVVLKAELEQARAEAALQDTRFKAGVIAAVEVQAAKDKVEILEAELTGDAVKIAGAEASAARRQWELASTVYKAGRSTGADYERVKGELVIAEAKLAEAEAKAAPAKGGSPNSERGMADPTVSPAVGAPVPVVAVRAFTGDIGVYRNYVGSVGRSDASATPKANEKPRDVPVVFSIPEADVQQVVTKFRAKQRLAVVAYQGSGMKKIGEGSLLSVADQIDANTATLECKAVVVTDGDDVLLPNAFLNVRLLLDVKRGVTLLPANAIQRNTQGSFVYLIKPDETATVRPVTVGTVEGGTAEIEEGLSPGDTAVLDPSDKLIDGSRVRLTPLKQPERVPNGRDK